MWFLDGPEYYDPPGARYLTYTHDVRRVVEELAVERFGGAMAPLYKQYVAVNYQIALFRCSGGVSVCGCVMMMVCVCARAREVGGEGCRRGTCKMITVRCTCCAEDCLHTGSQALCAHTHAGMHWQWRAC
jgi:hypothetical protein